MNRNHCFMLSLLLLATALPAAAAPAVSPQRRPDFAAFDRAARQGQRLNVVFFGGSLTWGANASDPQQTSYRARVAQRLVKEYPRAHFQFHDAAIGGTGSQLGVFRLDRDVLRHRPDLVFLDFSANDDIYRDDEETLASYESLVRRMVTEAKVPVVQIILPFRWNTGAAELPKLKRREAHLAIARAYNTAVGDAVVLTNQKLAEGKTTLDELWPLDGAHPGDKGYELFAEAAWNGLRRGIVRRTVCQAPPTMLHASTYMTQRRVRLSSFKTLPVGWRRGIANRTSAWYDSLMSRWLDDEVIASNRAPGASKTAPAEKSASEAPVPVESLHFTFSGSMLLLFGESTPTSGTYRVIIDGKPVASEGGDGSPVEFDAGLMARHAGGNVRYLERIAQGLDPAVEHSVEIVPLLDAKAHELRLESICVAGGQARVTPGAS